MILQFSQSFFTDARTFINYLFFLSFDNYPARRQIARRQFQLNPVANRQLRKTQTSFAAHKRQKPVAIAQLHPIPVVRQNFHYGTFSFDGTFSGHVKICGSDSVIRTVCSK